MTAICVPSSRPLEARKADALAKVVTATRGWSSQPMLVGAFARDVWFWHLNGIETFNYRLQNVVEALQW